MMPFVVREQTRGKSEIGLAIMESLPEWASAPELLARHVEEISALPFFIVSDAQDEIMGFLALKERAETCVEIYALAVLPEFHHQGRGALLLEAGERWAREKDETTLFVEDFALSHFPCARPFFEKKGFVTDSLSVRPGLIKSL